MPPRSLSLSLRVFPLYSHLSHGDLYGHQLDSFSTALAMQHLNTRASSSVQLLYSTIDHFV